MDFEQFNKIGRFSRNIIITEKIDGTNAQICIDKDGTFQVGSRTRWITPNKDGIQTDNYGFAAWAYENKEELMKLGPGRHYGEWWGNGIQRNYGIPVKKFSLFNVGRWSNPDSGRPSICDIVPVLFAGAFTTENVEETYQKLKDSGSVASPGFMSPEGIVVFHSATNAMFKKTFEHDDIPKSLIPEAALAE